MTERSMMDPAPQDVGARFETREQARAAVRRLTADAGVDPARVEILQGEGRMHAVRGRESRATRRALVRWHATLGLAGLGIGCLAWILGWYAGATMLMAMPWLMLFVLAGFGAVAGLLVAGLLSLRAGKGWLAVAARDDARAGLYPVVVHAANREEARRALKILAHARGDPYVGRAA